MCTTNSYAGVGNHLPGRKYDSESTNPETVCCLSSLDPVTPQHQIPEGYGKDEIQPTHTKSAKNIDQTESMLQQVEPSHKNWPAVILFLYV
jgi:hypothetical protein